MELGSRVLYLTAPHLEGEDVLAWQRIICTHPTTGAHRLHETARFDDNTDTITRLWQAEKRIPVDGIVGPVTLTAARHVTEPEGQPRPVPPSSEVQEVKARRAKEQPKDKEPVAGPPDPGVSQ